MGFDVLLILFLLTGGCLPVILHILIGPSSSSPRRGSGFVRIVTGRRFDACWVSVECYHSSEVRYDPLYPHSILIVETCYGIKHGSVHL